MWAQTNAAVLVMLIIIQLLADAPHQRWLWYPAWAIFGFTAGWAFHIAIGKGTGTLPPK